MPYACISASQFTRALRLTEGKNGDFIVQAVLYRPSVDNYSSMWLGKTIHYWKKFLYQRLGKDYNPDKCWYVNLSYHK